MSDPTQPLWHEPATTVAAHDEQLRVSKRWVDTGAGVRIDKRVHTRHLVVDEPLLHEQLEVTRVPVDRLVDPDQAPQPRYEGDTFIVPVLEEVLVLEKKVRIREEVHVTRRQATVRQAQEVPLRTEELIVEPFANSPQPRP